MRILKAKDIFNEKNVTKFDEEMLNIKAVKYFRDKYTKLLSCINKSENLLYHPIKRFEIFKLDTLGGKIFLAEKSELPEGEGKDIYYNLKIANEIYQKLIDIKEASFNEYDEIQYLYEREILKNEEEISELKLKDEELFKIDLDTYNTIAKTPLYERYQLLNRDKEHLLKENGELNKTISKYNENIRELSQKLKISLERIEYLQRRKTFREKLKELFTKDKKYLIDKKGNNR